MEWGALGSLIPFQTEADLKTAFTVSLPTLKCFLCGEVPSEVFLVHITKNNEYGVWVFVQQASAGPPLLCCGTYPPNRVNEVNSHGEGINKNSTWQEQSCWISLRSLFIKHNSTFCLAGDLRVAIRYEEPESRELERRVRYQSTEPSFQYSQWTEVSVFPSISPCLAGMFHRNVRDAQHSPAEQIVNYCLLLERNIDGNEVRGLSQWRHTNVLVRFPLLCHLTMWKRMATEFINK